MRDDLKRQMTTFCIPPDRGDPVAVALRRLYWRVEVCLCMQKPPCIQCSADMVVIETAWDASEPAKPALPPAVLARYHALVEVKHTVGLTETEAAEFARLFAEIDEADWNSPAERESRDRLSISSVALDLKPIKARVLAATPGPWINHTGEFVATAPGNPTASYMAICRVNRPVVVNWNTQKTEDAGYGSEQPNKEFIAHSISDVAALIKEVERMRREAHTVIGRLSGSHRLPYPDDVNTLIAAGLWSQGQETSSDRVMLGLGKAPQEVTSGENEVR